MTPPPEVPAGFGAALYELRKARGWSMLRAAGAAGVSTSVAARAEAGGNVGLAQAVGLASAYGATLGALLDGAAESTRETLR